MTAAELKAESVKLSREEQMELAAYLTDRLPRAVSDEKDGARITDDGDPNFTDPRDEPLQPNRL